MEYMNRAERRRAKRQGEKVSKPPVYNYTPGTLRNQFDYEAKADVREKLKKVREEATADAINTAMMLLLTLPCNVLIDKYWKDEPEKVQEFLDTVLDQYTRWQNGELDINTPFLKGDVSRAMGVDRVPYDNYPIMAHEGEKLLTKNEANQYERSTRGVRMVSRAMGTGEIREDGTPILAHEGEKLLTKQETKQTKENRPLEIRFENVTFTETADVDVIMEEMVRKLRKVQETMV